MFDHDHHGIVHGKKCDTRDFRRNQKLDTFFLKSGEPSQVKDQKTPNECNPAKCSTSSYHILPKRSFGRICYI